jgi:hypothetical protein
MKMVDTATGMTSKVPPELANRNISVKFSGLSVTDGVRKIFQGQPLDYVVIEGKGVTVTAASQNLNGTETVAAYPAGPGQPEPFVQDFQQQQPMVQPVLPGQNGFQPQPGVAPQQQQQQPAYVQTPFGQLPNSRFPQQNQNQNQPFSTPGSSLFPNGNTGQQSGALPPMGAPTTLGTGPQNSPNTNNTFGAAPNLFPGQIPHQ